MLSAGAGVGGGALILGCCICLLYSRRKKQRQASLSNLLSRSTSSKISSKKDPELGDTNYYTHIFSYNELEEATNGFHVSRELGNGGFGTVYKGTSNFLTILGLFHISVSICFCMGTNK